MLHFQHLLPEPVGSTLHDRLGHRLVPSAPFLPPSLSPLLKPHPTPPTTTTTTTTVRVTEHYLQQAVSHALQKLGIHVCLVEYSVSLSRIVAQSIHECFLVFFCRRDNGELEEDRSVECTEEVTQRENVGLFEGLFHEGEKELVDLVAGVKVHSLPESVHQATTEHADAGHGSGEDLGSSRVEDDCHVFVSNLQREWQKRKIAQATINM